MGLPDGPAGSASGVARTGALSPAQQVRAALGGCVLGTERGVHSSGCCSWALLLLRALLFFVSLPLGPAFIALLFSQLLPPWQISRCGLEVHDI